MSARAVADAFVHGMRKLLDPLDEIEPRLVVIVGLRGAVENLRFRDVVLELDRIAAGLRGRIHEREGLFGIAVVVRPDLRDDDAGLGAAGAAPSDIDDFPERHGGL